MRSKGHSGQRRVPRAGDLSDSANCVLRIPAWSADDLDIVNVAELGALVCLDPRAHRPEAGETVPGTLVLSDFFLIGVNARVAYVLPGESVVRVGVEFVGITAAHQALIRACFRYELLAAELIRERAQESAIYRYICEKTGSHFELELDPPTRSLKRITARTPIISVEWSPEATTADSERLALRRILRNLQAIDPELAQLAIELKSL